MSVFNYSTTYMGLALKNPFVVSSSGLTSTFDKVKACEEAGAGAVVLKSIFEEQLSEHGASLENYSDYPEAADYLRGYVEQNALREYIELIEKCAEGCSIPVIASINCSSAGSWVEYARHFERAGAAAIELNIFMLPSDATVSASELEEKYLAIVAAVREVVSIPVSVKIPSNFSAPLNVIQQLYFRKVNGVTMFNRFYTPDVDLRKLTLLSSGVFSKPEDLNSVLRWVALSSVQVPLVDVAASTGIHCAEGAIKALLCGAKVVEMCSALYANGLAHLTSVIKDVEKWAVAENFSSVDEFRGKLNSKAASNSEIHERAQFMRYFSTFEK